jgi:hypothetical protein
LCYNRITRINNIPTYNYNTCNFHRIGAPSITHTYTQHHTRTHLHPQTITFFLSTITHTANFNAQFHIASHTPALNNHHTHKHPQTKRHEHQPDGTPASHHPSHATAPSMTRVEVSYSVSRILCTGMPSLTNSIPCIIYRNASLTHIVSSSSDLSSKC